MQIFVMGGTGLIGSSLVDRLTERGDRVVVLTRRPTHAQARWGSQCTIVEGDPMKAGPWMQAAKDCDAVINLVGESIFARRWNDEFKKLLRDSRINSTQNVVQALAQSPKTPAGNPKVLVNASAIGYYGPRGDEEITEEGAPGDDTLARACVACAPETRDVGARARSSRTSSPGPTSSPASRFWQREPKDI